MNRKLKALFITHDSGNYGASRSLQLLLRNYAQVDADLVVQRDPFGRIDEPGLRQRFGPRVGAIQGAFLPFDTCYQYGRKGALFSLFIGLYNLLFGRRGARKIARIVAAGGYDVVHLNSLVLHTLISDQHPCVLHMRDVYDGTNPAAVRNVQKAAGVIFIDEATRAPFRDIPLRSSLVLNNPFDMSRVSEFADFRPGLPGLDTARNTVFSAIGVANDKKGTGFILEAFLRLDRPDARLLIVGGRERAALDRYRKLAQEDKRVIFWGEEPDIMKVYAISDYVLRGEEFPCIGRTVYEGLYAGCRVILPGDPDDPPPMFEYDAYRDAILFYRPRDRGDLVTVLRRAAGDKVRGRTLRSNVDAYVRAFHEYISSLAGP